MTLRALSENLYVAEQPLRFLGIEVGARMTVVRLQSGELVLHSPIERSPELADEVRGLGEPRWLLAPNRFHHLFIGDWHKAFPESQMLLVPGLPEKRPELQYAALLTDPPPAEWGTELEVASFPGFKLVNEAVLFHRPSRTLIATDLAFNLGEDSPLFTRLFMRVSGRVGELAPTLLEKVFIRDRPAFRAVLDRVLEWPFERVIVSHGDVLESGGREALAHGYEWLR